MNPIDDRTTEEMLPQNKNVIAFLRHATVSSPTPSQEIQAQALARVRLRLLEEGQLETEELGSLEPLAQTSAHENRENSPTLLRRRFLWKKRLGLLVAVLCVALLTGSFVAVEQLAHHRNTITGASSHDSSPSKSGQFVYFPIVQVHMNGLKFNQSSVVIHKGMGIELISDDHVECIISNGYWRKNADAVPLKEKGIPKVGFIRIGYTYTSRIIGPFNTMGTYHLYDTIHSDKTLIVIVQK